MLGCFAWTRAGKVTATPASASPAAPAASSVSPAAVTSATPTVHYTRLTETMRLRKHLSRTQSA